MNQDIHDPESKPESKAAPKSEQNKKDQIGRNEPCPCGSRKKYKRCCGISAAPKLTPPSDGLSRSAAGVPPGMNPEAISKLANQMDQQQMMQLAQAFQRLPKGQLQRFQALMQKAMSGKDVSREAAELETTLPPDFQEMIKGFKMPEMPGLLPDAALAGSSSTSTESPPAGMTQEMTEDEARAIVAQAAEAGKISEEEAKTLLAGASTKESGGFSKFWKKLSGGNKGSGNSGNKDQ